MKAGSPEHQQAVAAIEAAGAQAEAARAQRDVAESETAHRAVVVGLLERIAVAVEGA